MSIFYSIWKIYKILIFHNLKRYDIHHKMDEIGKFNQNIYIYIYYTKWNGKIYDFFAMVEI